MYDWETTQEKTGEVSGTKTYGIKQAMRLRVEISTAHAPFLRFFSSATVPLFSVVLCDFQITFSKLK
jgi:hypothetical protein